MQSFLSNTPTCKKTHKLLVKGKRMFLLQDVDVPRWLTRLSRLAPQ